MQTPPTSHFQENGITIPCISHRGSPVTMEIDLETLDFSLMEIDSPPSEPTPMEIDSPPSEQDLPSPKRRKTFHATPHRLPFTEKPDAYGIAEYRRNQRQNGVFYSQYQYSGDSPGSSIVLP